MASRLWGEFERQTEFQAASPERNRSIVPADGEGWGADSSEPVVLLSATRGESAHVNVRSLCKKVKKKKNLHTSNLT